MINWQLSKQGIRWPLSPDRSTGSSVDPSRSSIFLKLSADKLPVWNDRRLKFFFQGFISNMLCLCHYGPVLFGFWFQTKLERKNSASFFLNYRRGRPYLTMITRWSPSSSTFYTLIGQNLTGEFMQKNYAASWKLCTLTAEADRVLRQLVMFLTVFFIWMCKVKYSCYQESSVIHGWFVYWVFGWEMRRLSKLGNSISFFTLLNA